MGIRFLPNERVIFKEENCSGYNEVILTDQNLILYKTKTRLFKEKEEYIKEYPLRDINIINGEPQVYSAAKNFPTYVLKICVGNEIVELQLEQYGKDKTTKWINMIFQILVGHSSNEKTVLGSILGKTKSLTSMGGKEIGESIGSALGSVVGNIKSKYNDSVEDATTPEDNGIVSIHCSGCNATLTGYKNQLVECPYCGTTQKL